MMTEVDLSSDTQLVERCLDGDREAFGRIVERYQGLVCALAYNACGDISRSEDVAQETFLAAWRNLQSLKDRHRLKQWLCGIARHIVQESHRRAARDPMATSTLLEEEVTRAGNSLQPDQQMISREEQAILWRVLEGLPATYREPLILFYRQEQSVAEVAETMELSEDAVKQRLSRGREMLSERTVKFVETALHSSGPGKVFTLGVLAALPVLTASTKAAVVGATAAKGSATAKATAGATGLATRIVERLHMIAKTKMAVIMAVGIVAAAAVTTPIFLQHRENARLSGELAQTRAENEAAALGRPQQGKHLAEETKQRDAAPQRAQAALPSQAEQKDAQLKADREILARTVNFDFQNAPIIAVIKWLVRLTDKPLIVPHNAVGVVNYRTERKLTRNEAIREIAGILATNDLYLVNVNNLYYRLVRASETNKVVDSPRVEIEIDGDKLSADGKPIQREDLAETFTRLITPQTEVWISDRTSSLNPSSSEGVVKLLTALPVATDKVYFAYLPWAK